MFIFIFIQLTFSLKFELDIESKTQECLGEERVKTLEIKTRFLFGFRPLGPPRCRTFINCSFALIS